MKKKYPRINDVQYCRVWSELGNKTTDINSTNFSRKGICGRDSSENQCCQGDPDLEPRKDRSLEHSCPEVSFRKSLLRAHDGTLPLS